MLDPHKVRSLVTTLGWPRTAFLLSVALLASRIVTFEQCMILLLIALGARILETPMTAGR
jgi:hypothetical protein